MYVVDGARAAVELMVRVLVVVDHSSSVIAVPFVATTPSGAVAAAAENVTVQRAPGASVPVPVVKVIAPENPLPATVAAAPVPTWAVAPTATVAVAVAVLLSVASAEGRDEALIVPLMSEAGSTPVVATLARPLTCEAGRLPVMFDAASTPVVATELKPATLAAGRVPEMALRLNPR